MRTRQITPRVGHAPGYCAALAALLAAAPASAVPPSFTGQPIAGEVEQAGSFVVNLRDQGVVTGTAPMQVVAGQVVMDGLPISDLQVTAVPANAPTSVCVRFDTLGVGSFSTLTVELTATNLLNESTGPVAVSIVAQAGATVEESDPACLDPNQSPTANAGLDRTVPDSDGQDGEDVALDGSASNDPDGVITSYEWTDSDGAVIATGPTPTVRLADGVHQIVLTVTDDSGDPQTNTATDTVVISVGGEGPTVTIDGGSRTVADSDGLPGESVVLSATATVSGIAEFQWFDAEETLLGTEAQITVDLPDGANEITVFVQDEAGNTASDTVIITVGDASEGPGLAELPGLSPNQRATAQALDSLCPRLAERAQTADLPPDQADLLARCNGVISSDTPERIAALQALGAQNLNALRTQSVQFTGTQNAGVMDRLIALRGGARGLSLAGLNLHIDGKRVPLAQLMEVARELVAGGASGDADEPGGLFGDRLGLWVRGNYGFGEKAATAADAGFDSDQWGLMAGVDYRLTEGTVLGLAGAYGSSKVAFAGAGGGFDARSWTLSGYGTSYAAGNFYIDAIFNYGSSDYDSRRRILYTESGTLIDRTASGSTDGSTLSGGVSAGYDFAVGGLTISPNASLSHLESTIRGFRESGAQGLDLEFDKQRFRASNASVGLRLSFAWNTAAGVLLPHLRTDYVRELKNNVAAFGVRFANDPFAEDTDPTPLIIVRSDAPDRSYWRLAAGASAQFKHGVSAYTEYQRYEGFQHMSFEDIVLGLRVQRALR